MRKFKLNKIDLTSLNCFADIGMESKERTFMTPTWQNRQSERQNLHEELKRQIHDFADACNMEEDPAERQRFHFALLFLMGRNLLQTSWIDGTSHIYLNGDGKYELCAAELLRTAIKPAISNFSRIPEEERAITAELVEFCLNIVIEPIKASLQHQEIFNSEKVFHVPTATPEIRDH